jgi:hypothetical protein
MLRSLRQARIDCPNMILAMHRYPISDRWLPRRQGLLFRGFAALVTPSRPNRHPAGVRAERARVVLHRPRHERDDRKMNLWDGIELMAGLLTM